MDSDKMVAGAGFKGESRFMKSIQHDLEESRYDYSRFLVEYGLTPEVVKTIVESSNTQIEMPEQFDKLHRGKSLVHGDGMFAKASLSVNELIAPGRINGKRTPAGRYINHSVVPNAKFIYLENGDIDAIAVRQIDIGEEVFVDYRQAASVNKVGLICKRHEAFYTVGARLCARAEKFGYKLALPLGEILSQSNQMISTMGYVPAQYVDSVTVKT